MLTNSLEAAAVARSAAPPRRPAIRAAGVRKAYGAVQALDGVDLTVRRGELLALLGPNGAGKTTLLEILEGHRRADAGEVSVLGHDPGAARARPARADRDRAPGGGPGPEPQRARGGRALRRRLPRAAPRRRGARAGRPRRPGDARAASLSGGQRRRLDLALGIAGDPELIFLDEPTTGFDPGARRRSWELIARLRELGKTILLTTHYMEEAQALADRVVVLAGGRVVAEGTPDSLAAAAARRSSPTAGRRDASASAPPTPTADLLPLLRAAVERGEELEGLTVTRPSLEDVYLQLTEEPA